jgi:hypothetical protein
VLLIPQSFIDRPLVPFRRSWRAAWGGAAIRLRLALLPGVVAWFYTGHDDECRKDDAGILDSTDRYA